MLDKNVNAFPDLLPPTSTEAPDTIPEAITTKREGNLGRERKTKHLNLLLKPSTFEKLKTQADNKGMSIAEYLEYLVDLY